MKLSILEAIQQEQEEKEGREMKGEKEEDLCESLVEEVKNISQLFRSKES